MTYCNDISRYLVSILGGAALCLALAAPVSATSVVMMEDHQLARSADAIVLGRVLGPGEARLEGKVVTEYRVAVEELLQGSYVGDELRLQVPGGVHRSSGRATILFGAPEFEAGDRVLLFVREKADGSVHVAHLMQGAFWAHEDADGLYFERPIGQRGDLGLGEKVIGSMGRDGEAFLDWLRAGDFGEPGLASYLRGIDRPPAPPEKFTTIDEDEVYRWYEWDPADPGDFIERGKVIWKMHRDGNDDLPNGGRRQLARSFKAWNGERETGVRLKLRGKTGSTAGFEDLDQLNTVLFEDFNDDMDDFECGSGGTLAVGGISGIWRDEREWKGRVSTPASEAEIIINDGVECAIGGDRKTWEALYTHEIGHTLGLGHSCGDDSSPDCDESETLDAAVMKAFLTFGRGRDLGVDDEAALRFLYDPTFRQIPCDLPPGHKRFCRKCGPCGEEQGNCRRDKHCAEGLTCVRNVGPDYDLPAGTNVCLAE